MQISKTKLKNAAIAAKSGALPKIPKELLNQFVTGPMTGEAVNAASMAGKKALIGRALGAEFAHHLGYQKRRNQTRDGGQPAQRKERQDPC
jgi:putative transposase